MQSVPQPDESVEQPDEARVVSMHDMLADEPSTFVWIDDDQCFALWLIMYCFVESHSYVNQERGRISNQTELVRKYLELKKPPL